MVIMKKVLDYTLMFKKLQRFGFTMIELLIVIAVLGILAVAVLAAINPIEQINRGRDTGSRSDAEQLLSAIDRFYASQGYYPWQTGATDTDAEALAWTAAQDVADADTEAMLEKLSEGGTAEIKESFVSRITDDTYNTLQIYNRGTQGDSTYVCFAPKSGAFTEEANVRCGEDGDDLPDDLSDMADTVCESETELYVCLP
jgi:prepilin-type N-terminal cleavage/methylation domain-containing protein